MCCKPISGASSSSHTNGHGRGDGSTGIFGIEPHVVSEVARARETQTDRFSGWNRDVVIYLSKEIDDALLALMVFRQAHAQEADPHGIRTRVRPPHLVTRRGVHNARGHAIANFNR